MPNLRDGLLGVGDVEHALWTLRALNALRALRPL